MQLGSDLEPWNQALVEESTPEVGLGSAQPAGEGYVLLVYLVWFSYILNIPAYQGVCQEPTGLSLCKGMIGTVGPMKGIFQISCINDRGGKAEASLTSLLPGSRLGIFEAKPVRINQWQLSV